jgi:hypothetical protein
MLNFDALLWLYSFGSFSYKHRRTSCRIKFKTCQNTLMKHALNLFAAFLLASILCGCNSAPLNKVEAKPNLEFIDLDGFDLSLNASLAANLPVVDVAVMNATTATSIPPRIQPWLQSVESSGGQVTVIPPKSTVASKNPLLLLTLISGIWNTTRATKAINAHGLHKSANKYDAELLLKIDDKGERLIDKIIFTERKR